MAEHPTPHTDRYAVRRRFTPTQAASRQIVGCADRTAMGGALRRSSGSILQKLRKALDGLRAEYKKLLYFGPLGKTPKRRTPERYRLAVVHQQLQLLTPIYRALRAVLEPNQRAVGDTMHRQLAHYDKQLGKLRTQVTKCLQRELEFGAEYLLPDTLDVELPEPANLVCQSFLPARSLRTMCNEVQEQLQAAAAKRVKTAREQEQSYRQFIATLTPKQRLLAEQFARNGVATLHARDF